MIICTKTADLYVKKAFSKDKVSIAAFANIITSLNLDPTISEPQREAYVITSDDIKNAKLKQQLVAALATKHPKARVIFIDKQGKNVLPQDTPGIDALLSKPRPAQVPEVIGQVIAVDAVSDVAQIQEQPIIAEIPEFDPVMEFPEPPAFQEPEEFQQPDFFEQPIMPEVSIPLPEPEPVYVPQVEPEPEDRGSEYVGRIKNASTVSDIGIVMREMTASALIKEMVDSNTSYAMVEEKLKSINDSIFSIMQDPTIRTLEEKLTKVRALTHDKAFFSSKGNTLIEQRLEEVIDTICSQTSSLLQSRLDEIDTAIIKVKTAKEMDAGSPRLAGLNEERINLILELRTLEMELEAIYKNTDNLVMGVVTDIAEKAIDITGNEILNAQIRARGDILVGNSTKDAIRAAMTLSNEKLSSEFSTMHVKVVAMVKVLSKLFDLDREIIAAQQQLINFLRANKIEDTVIAESLLKKSLRLFVADEGTGRTIIPYLLSYYKSRQNANVLLFDITGTGKYAEYNIPTMTPENFLINQNQQEFLVVSGNVANTVATAQRIVTALTKAADYYRVVNVILRPDQKELLETIAPDVLCINYITDVTPAHISTTKTLMEELQFENVAQRVILNKCDIPVKPIITRLGLDDKLDFQICTIPTIPAITDANINGYNPYGLSSVSALMDDVLKHA